MTTNKQNQGEGNIEADRRYRKEVRESVESTTEKERAEKARNAGHEPDETKAGDASK